MANPCNGSAVRELPFKGHLGQEEPYLRATYNSTLQTGSGAVGDAADICAVCSALMVWKIAACARRQCHHLVTITVSAVSVTVTLTVFEQ